LDSARAASHQNRSDFSAEREIQPGRKRPLQSGFVAGGGAGCGLADLIGGRGLFARSLINLQKEDLGFNRDNVLLASVDTRLAGYKPKDSAPCTASFMID